MLSLFRIFLSIAIFLMSWSLMIGVILVFIALAQHGFNLWLAPLWNDGIMACIQVAPRYVSIFEKMLYHHDGNTFLLGIAVKSILLGCAILFVNIFLSWFRPIQKDIQSTASDQQLQRLPSESDLAHAVETLAKRAKIKIPLVYITQSNDINAFAIKKPFRSAIVLTIGTTQLTDGQLLWIISHEMGHIKRGDAIPSTLWMAANRTAVQLSNLRVYILHFLHPIFIRLPFIRLFVAPIEWWLLGLFHITSLSEFLAIRVFTLIDRYLLRAVEYQADAFASAMIDPQYGIEVMNILSKAKIKSTLMQTHPSPENRILRLTCA